MKYVCLQLRDISGLKTTEKQQLNPSWWWSILCDVFCRCFIH